MSSFPRNPDRVSRKRPHLAMSAAFPYLLGVWDDVGTLLQRMLGFV